ncbi:hypothetical protein QVD17_15788 [Tagetes erecta]|uniref:Uncharacterized protein n=1 Tax=Tagetes erecta TaxID=13708 RepID=A0AAD8KWL6_TARER|nr:hypothetical protein QVD17_15788 [Tagetes erecta]
MVGALPTKRPFFAKINVIWSIGPLFNGKKRSQNRLIIVFVKAMDKNRTNHTRIKFLNNKLQTPRTQ